MKTNEPIYFYRIPDLTGLQCDLHAHGFRVASHRRISAKDFPACTARCEKLPSTDGLDQITIDIPMIDEKKRRIVIRYLYQRPAEPECIRYGTDEPYE